MYSAGVHPMKAPVCAGLIKRYLQWVVLLKNSAYIPNICKMSFKRLPMPKPGGGTWGEICKISRCKSIVVLSPFHWYFSREKTSVWKHKDCHKHHWCCWGCWKHKAKLLTTAEKRERGRERSTINSQITHVKTHNWPCWSNDSEPRYQDIKLKYFLCEKGYTVEHALETIKSIVEYFNKRYGNKMPEMSKAAVNSHVDEGIVYCLMWVKFVNAMFDLIQQK